MSLGAPEIILIILAVLLLFGYKKLPDASRSIGRSLRIFKGEMKGLKDDDVRGKEPATTTPVRGEVVTPAGGPTAADAELATRLAEEARAAEARAAELRARAEQARAEQARAAQPAPAQTATAQTTAAPASPAPAPSAEGPRWPTPRGEAPGGP